MSTSFAVTKENKTLATLYVVTDPDDDMTPYLREKLEEWLDKSQGRTLDKAAEIGRISKTQLSNLKNGTRGGGGRKTIQAMMRVLGATHAQLEDAAREHGETRRRRRPASDVDCSPLEVELDPRYPALAEAIRLRAERWAPETQRQMAGQANHALFDRSVGQWIDDGDRLDAQNRKGIAHGRQLEDEDDAPPAGR
jgi:hypothetical protein